MFGCCDRQSDDVTSARVQVRAASLENTGSIGESTMGKSLLAFFLGCALAGGVGYWVVRDQSAGTAEKITELQQVITTKDESLLAHTRYKDYLAASKKSLSGQTKFLAATVTRQYMVNRRVQRSVMGAKSNGAIVVSYVAEYSFGYDMAPTSYEVVDGPNGIEIRIGRPMLVAPPAVRGLANEVLASGLFTDERAATLNLYEDASTLANADGLKLQSDEEIVALCEKRLTAFLHDFLAKQPGVKQVPAISVSYTSPRPAKTSRQDSAG